MSIIEQAARRLEELRRSGIELPASAARVAHTVPRAPEQLAHPESAPAARPAGSPPTQLVPRASAQAAGAADGVERSRLVRIDLKRLATIGYIAVNQPRARIADEFRIIKRQLLAPVNDIRRQNLIMVTSALPGEGKTFVAINLALSIAMERDKTVLLVDADVARPAVLERLGVPPAEGLLDIIAGSSPDPADVLLRTNIDKLSLLPAGKPRGQADELLASEDMIRLLDEMSSRYADRIVVFDAPPLLPSTESRVLAAQMGQVVLVVEAERTPHRAVTEALKTIEACPVILPLLNKVSRSEVGNYYGHYGSVEN